MGQSHRQNQVDSWPETTTLMKTQTETVAWTPRQKQSDQEAQEERNSTLATHSHVGRQAKESREVSKQSFLEGTAMRESWSR